jgi:hypothetical protein
MFSQEEFVKFLDNYRNRLVETDDMLEESKVNYRVKKLAVFYGLKNHEAFKSFFSNELGRKYLGIAKYVLNNVRDHELYGSQEVKEVANSLLNKYFDNTSIAPVYDDELLEGYFKFLCDFTRRNKIKQLKEELGEVNVNLDSLEFVS